MSLLQQRRAFLAAYRKSGSLAKAAESMDLPADIHEKWLADKDGWLYRTAFVAIEKEMKDAGESKSTKGSFSADMKSPTKRPPGRPKKALPPAAKEPKRIGRPPKSKGGDAPCPQGTHLCDEAPAESVAAGAGSSQSEPAPSNEVEKEEVAPAAPVVEHVFPGDKGYVKLFTPEGEVPAPPPEPEKPKRQAHEAPAEPPLDLAIATDETQRAMIDEYGELDRRMQIRATEIARYEVLKRAIKTWFSSVPADADGCVEGDVYLLHLSACERERKIRDMQALIEAVGLEKVLEIATIPLGVLENMLGKDRVSFLTTETRSGSRRIKAIAKRPAAVANG